jgi:alginate O-acetyltransferase complex protein AlgI
MIFNSFAFLLFFICFYVLYLIIPKHKPRIILCLLGSYFFYGWWDWRFLSLIIFSTLVDYYLGLKISSESAEKKRKKYLLLSLFSNLGLLFFFKYFNFFIESFAQMLENFGMNASISTLNIILPVGISFYTFQTLSYTIDIYRKKLQPEKNFMIFATYVSFFPQLVAGPIVRAIDLLPQFKSIRKISSRQINTGILLIAIGFFKKIVIADSLAPLIDDAFINPYNYTSLNMLLVVIFYAFQIYCDFSGYSDIAIGLGRLLGYEFPENFNLPYFAKNFSDLWRRWHISLSSWLKDYLYISLGGNRNGYYKTQRNLMLTMTLGGLWHGANWTFIIWGVLHGTYLIVQRVIDPATSKIKKLVPKPAYLITSIVITFIFVNFAWIFFRSQNIEQAFAVINKISAFDNWSLSALKPKFQVSKAIFLVLILFTGELLYYNFGEKIKSVLKQSLGARISLVVFISIMILLFGNFSSNNFIYFQF